MEPLFQIPDDFSALSDDELSAWIAEAQARATEVANAPSEFVGADRTAGDLMDEVTAGVAAIEQAKAELASRSTTEDEPEEDEPEAEAALTDEQQAALAELAATAAGEFTEDAPEEEAPEEEAAAEDEPEEEPEPEAAVVPAAKPKAIVAAGTRTTRLARPSRTKAATPPAEESRVSLTAAAENLGFGLGEEIDGDDVARMMVKRRGQFGTVPEGTRGEKIPLARAEWGDLYPEERRLSEEGVGENLAKVEAVVASAEIRRAFLERRSSSDGESLVASGGLCAPVTPYYSLQMLSTATRPVRDSLPAFNADRGGINHARPASLSAIDDAVGIRTEAEDANASDAVKTCQRIDCPDFEEVDVSIVYHCLEFGNVASRTYPELVQQWNQLVLAAHARAAETALLDGIGTGSTAVTAGDLGLGASANLINQLTVAAVAMRSRNRMAPDAVVRAQLPFWITELFRSDVIRTQFQRFEMTAAEFVAQLRESNIEPSFYLDGETGAGQVFGAQAAGALHSYPTTVVSYVYPEGSFLYLDGGTLELGLVRDSSLNRTNDFQIFGETFENVAFVGVESIKLTSTLCDSGTVSLPDAVDCPVTY